MTRRITFRQLLETRKQRRAELGKKKKRRAVRARRATAPPEPERFDLKPKRGETAEDRERNSYELVKRLESMSIPIPRELAISSSTRSKFEHPTANGSRLPRKPNTATVKQPGPHKPEPPRKPNPEAERQRREQQDRALRQAGVPIAFHAPWGKPN